MKKLFMFILVLTFVAPCLVFAQKQKSNAKQAAAPVITSAMMLAEEFQKSGVTGPESEEGLLQEVFRLMGLRKHRKITGRDFYVQIWDFKSAWGFNTADFIYNLYSMLTGTAVYKSRPFIIVINSKNEASRKKVIDSLRKLIPDVKEAGDREY